MEEYSVGVPYGGTWRELLNSDAEQFGGSGVTNKPLKAAKKESHGQAYSITFRLAPLAVQIFEGEDLPKKKPAKKAGKPAATAKPAKKKAAAPKKEKKV